MAMDASTRAGSECSRAIQSASRFDPGEPRPAGKINARYSQSTAIPISRYLQEIVTSDLQYSTGEYVGSIMRTSKLSATGSSACRNCRSPNAVKAEDGLEGEAVFPLFFGLPNLCLLLAKFVFVIWPLICLASLGPRPGALLTLTNVKDGAMLIFLALSG